MNQKKNLAGMSMVVLLHVALLAAFLHGSRLTVFKPAPPVIDVLPNLDPPKLKEPEPRIEEPQLERPVVQIPPIPDQVTVEPLPTVTAKVTPDPQPLPPQARTGQGQAEPGARTQTAAPVVTAAVVDAQACTKPDYPKNALRNGDTGTVMLAFLIGADGKVADARVEKSSGFRELDRAAQAGLSLCRFKPGTVDGVPQSSWTRMQYVWSLD